MGSGVEIYTQACDLDAEVRWKDEPSLSRVRVRRPPDPRLAVLREASDSPDRWDAAFQKLPQRSGARLVMVSVVQFVGIERPDVDLTNASRTEHCFFAFDLGRLKTKQLRNSIWIGVS